MSELNRLTKKILPMLILLFLSVQAQAETSVSKTIAPLHEIVQISFEKKHLMHLLLFVGCLVILLVFSLTMYFVLLRKKSKANTLKDNFSDQRFSEVFSEEMILKFALANQYFESGDLQNARTLLGEIVVHGHVEHQEKARALLTEISER